MGRARGLATVIRSTNAGPINITLDIMFDDAEVYEQVKPTGMMNPELFARLDDVQPEEVFLRSATRHMPSNGPSLAVRPLANRGRRRA
jgi:hypothetical protein